jgi:uncharacterized membrane protein
MRARESRTAYLVALLAALILAFLPASAQAAVQIITPYPAVTVQAGKTVTLNLEVITTPNRQRVGLEVIQVPPGWQASLRGAGFVVHGVFGAPSDAPQVQLEVTVPPDAGPGDYRLLVRATAPGASNTLALDLRVSEIAPGAVTLTPEFETLRGSATDTFSYTLTLNNNTPEQTTFGLTAEGPPGWQVQARPTAEQRAATVSVDGGGSAQIEVEADPPDDVTAEVFPIRVQAVGGGLPPAEVELKAEITGSFEITLTTPTERLSARTVAGRPAELSLVIKNEGTAPMSGVRLTSSPPSGWRVSFEPSTVSEIPAQDDGRATARITPPGNAVAGDYVVTLSASSDGTSDDAEIRVTVQTSRVWGFIGLLVIAAAIGGLLWVFRTYGRR